MATIPPPPVPTQLIVFADDWGRHPSSSQHLIRELLPHYPTLWVNTVGTRKPRLSLSDFSRFYHKLRDKMNPFMRLANRIMQQPPENLTIISPMMYPGFRSPWQRRFNAKRIAHAVNARLQPGNQYIVITTLPITADLPEQINADRWVYYCVDDYAQWPGVDLEVLQAMEREQLPKMHAFAAVSEVLKEHIQAIVPEAGPMLINHGVDQDLWSGEERERWNESLNSDDPLDDTWWWNPPDWVQQWEKQSVALFGGLIDARLEVDWLKALKSSSEIDRIALIGPTNSPPASLSTVADLPGKVTPRQLSAIAELASVLIMPYIDAPVTRAMQPLKLLEYLATMKPVVVRDLPSTRVWADCCDLASDAESFVRLVEERIKTGTPPEQIEARKRRLAGESWTAKAAQLAELINAG